MQLVKVVFVLLAISCMLDIPVSASLRSFWIKLWTPKDEHTWGDDCDRNCRAVCIEQFNDSDYSIGSVCNKDGWCVCKTSDSSHVIASALSSVLCMLFVYQFY